MRVIFFFGFIISGIIALASMITIIKAFVAPDPIQDDFAYRLAGIGITTGLIFLTGNLFKKYRKYSKKSHDDILDLD